MYCPNCGVNNQTEVKFCTRCGTNLGVVSEALTGKFKGKPDSEDRMMESMRDYYGGRRDSITGATVIAAAILIMVIMVAAGLNPIAAFFIVCWMFFWGTASLASGLGKWLAASNEMKSIGYGSRSQFQGETRPQGRTGSQAELRASGYSTGAVGSPGSVTEHTTRQLDEPGYGSFEGDREPSR